MNFPNKEIIREYCPYCVYNNSKQNINCSPFIYNVDYECPFEFESAKSIMERQIAEKNRIENKFNLDESRETDICKLFEIAVENWKEAEKEKNQLMKKILSIKNIVEEEGEW